MSLCHVCCLISVHILTTELLPSLPVLRAEVTKQVNLLSAFAIAMNRLPGQLGSISCYCLLTVINCRRLRLR